MGKNEKNINSGIQLKSTLSSANGLNFLILDITVKEILIYTAPEGLLLCMRYPFFLGRTEE